MTQTLEIARCLQKFAVIPVSVAIAEAQKTLQNRQYEFVLIGDTQQPQTLVQASDLMKLNASASLFSEVIQQLPALVVVDGRNENLDSDEVMQILLLLEQADAPGVVVYQDQQVQGVISWFVFSQFLPFPSLIGMQEKGIERGNSPMPARTDICRKCAKTDPVPRFWTLRTGDEQPICPRHWSHGPMQREDV